MNNFRGLSDSLRRIKVEYVFTVIVGLLSLLGQVYIVRLVSLSLGVQAVSLYLVGRRMMAIVEPLVTLGMSTALPKYIAQTEDSKEQSTYLFAGLMICSVMTSVWFFFCLIFAASVSELLFGSSENSSLILPFNILLAGTVVYVNVYGFLRGTFNFYLSSMLQLSFIFLIPAFFLLFLSFTSLGTYWLLCGVSFFSVSLIVAVLQSKSQISIFYVTSTIKRLVQFGIQRMPTNVLLMTYFALPVSLTIQASTVEHAGIVSLSMTLVNLTGYIFALVDTILLPYASKSMMLARASTFNKSVNSLILIVLVASSLVTLTLWISAEWLTQVLLGMPTTSELHKLLLIGLPPYCVYASFRGLVDALYEKARITTNMLISILIYILFVIMGFRNDQLMDFSIYGFVIGLYVLGALVLRDVKNAQNRVLSQAFLSSSGN